MSNAQPTPLLRLKLQANDVLPERESWIIQEGYLRILSWNDEGEAITLGLCGPGEWLTRDLFTHTPLELQCLSHVVVEQFHPSADDITAFLRHQLRNTVEISQITRVRHADHRLLRLLCWIGCRFGQVSSRGYRLSLRDMNLTHRLLADISGLSRVTVTKCLSRFRAAGLLERVSEADLLIPRPASLPPAC